MNGLVIPAVNILYTSAEGTRAALSVARSLSKDLDIGIRLLAFQVVPPRLSMTEPPISPEFAVNQILQAFNSCDLSDVTVEHVLCREKEETILRWVTEEATIVIGGRNSLFPSEEMRLARYFKSKGFDVIFVPVKRRFWPRITVAWSGGRPRP